MSYDPLALLGTELDMIAGDEVEALLGGWDIIGAAGRQAPRRGRGYQQMPQAHAAVAESLARRALAQRAVYTRQTSPNHTNRIILPMTSSGNITASAAVTARPQSVAYRPEKIIVGGTPTDWLIDDIKVGNRSQFAQAGSMPAEAFASNALGNEVTFETVQTAMDFVIQVTFLGAASAGAQFRSVVFGTAVDR